MVDVQWFLDCHGGFCMKSWKVLFVTISLRLRTSPADSDLVGYCGNVFAGKGRCKDNSCGNPSLDCKKLHSWMFFQAVEEWLQPMIMFGIPRCHWLLLPFATLFSLKDHLVKLLLLGDSAVGKFLPQNFGGTMRKFSVGRLFLIRISSTPIQVIAADALLWK